MGGGGGGGGQVDVSSQTYATVSEFHLKLLTNNYTKYEGRLVPNFARALLKPKTKIKALFLN